MKLNAADKPIMRADTPVTQAITAVRQAVTPVRSSIVREAAEINLYRICRAAPIAMLINLAHLVMFLFFTPVHDTVDAAWRSGILMAHSASLVLSAFILLISSRLRQRKNLSIRALYVFQNAVIAFLLLQTVGIVTIDQMVTSNITPFIILCTLISVIFLLDPRTAATVYLGTYLLYHIALGLTQANPVVLMSNRVNGLTVVGIGIILSLILWQNHTHNFEQRELIARQNQTLANQTRELERQKGRLEDQRDALENLNQRLTHLASHDDLTDLLNRREFENRISNVAIGRREGDQTAKDSCIMMVDIDHFKDINDACGHPCGDELLRQFARILREELRESDLIARWGGEEFIVWLPDTDSGEGMLVAERIRQRLAGCIFIIEGIEVLMTASFGIADLHLTDETPLLACYHKADKALYTAKNLGRNRSIVSA